MINDGTYGLWTVSAGDLKMGHSSSLMSHVISLFSLGEEKEENRVPITPTILSLCAVKSCLRYTTPWVDICHLVSGSWCWALGFDATCTTTTTQQQQQEIRQMVCPVARDSFHLRRRKTYQYPDRTRPLHLVTNKKQPETFCENQCFEIARATYVILLC